MENETAIQVLNTNQIRTQSRTRRGKNDLEESLRISNEASRTKLHLFNSFAQTQACPSAKVKTQKLPRESVRTCSSGRSQSRLARRVPSQMESSGGHRNQSHAHKKSETALVMEDSTFKQNMSQINEIKTSTITKLRENLPLQKKMKPMPTHVRGNAIQIKEMHSLKVESKHGENGAIKKSQISQEQLKSAAITSARNSVELSPKTRDFQPLRFRQIENIQRTNFTDSSMAYFETQQNPIVIKPVKKVSNSNQRQKLTEGSEHNINMEFALTNPTILNQNFTALQSRYDAEELHKFKDAMYKFQNEDYIKNFRSFDSKLPLPLTSIFNSPIKGQSIVAQLNSSVQKLRLTEQANENKKKPKVLQIKGLRISSQPKDNIPNLSNQHSSRQTSQQAVLQMTHQPLPVQSSQQQKKEQLMAGRQDGVMRTKVTKVSVPQHADAQINQPNVPVKIISKPCSHQIRSQSRGKKDLLLQTQVNVVNVAVDSPQNEFKSAFQVKSPSFNNTIALKKDTKKLRTGSANFPIQIRDHHFDVKFQQDRQTAAQRRLSNIEQNDKLIGPLSNGPSQIYFGRSQEPTIPAAPTFVEFLQDQFQKEISKRKQQNKYLADYSQKAKQAYNDSLQNVDFMPLNGEVQASRLYYNSVNQNQSRGYGELPDLNQTFQRVLEQMKHTPIKNNIPTNATKERQSLVDAERPLDQRQLGAMAVLIPGTQSRVSSMGSQSRQWNQELEHAKELEIMKHLLAKEYGIAKPKTDFLANYANASKKIEDDITVTGTNILQDNRIKSQLAIIQELTNQKKMLDSKKFDVAEFAKSLDLRKQLANPDMPDEEDLPVMVLALLKRNTGTPLGSEKKKLDPISSIKNKSSLITPKLTFRSQKPTKKDLPEICQIPWLELVKLPSMSLPKMEKALIDAKELKPGWKVPDPVIDYRDHSINQVIRKSNEFLIETFLKPSDMRIDLKKVQSICAFFKIPICQKLVNEPQKLKNKEFQIVAKERILICLYEAINKENALLHPDFNSDPLPTLAAMVGIGPSNFYTNNQQQQINEATQLQFPVNPFRINERRFFIGFGNNHPIVRSVFKQRWWWSPTETNQYPSFEGNNFIWTQWRRDNLVEELPTLRDALARHRQQQSNQSEEAIQKRKKVILGLGQQMAELQSQKDKVLSQQREATEEVVQEKKVKKAKKSAGGKKSKKKAVKPKPAEVQELTQDEEKFDLENDSPLLLKELDKKIKEIEQKLKDEREKNQKEKEANNKQERVLLYGKMEHNYHLSNKKALFWNMSEYYKALGQDPFENLPLTFHIEHGLTDKEFINFRKYFNALKEKIDKQRSELIAMMPNRTLTETVSSNNESCFDDESLQQRFGVYIPKNIWITKPGENSNRGSGITVCDTMQEIIAEVSASAKSGHTHIIQKYIDRPLLFQGRKFDIRAYGMLTSINGIIKGYFYEDGYLRTSSQPFNLANLKSKFVHLTNDAVQCHDGNYGRFESGNKLSYQTFQKYLEHAFPERNVSFENAILPQIKRLITEAFIATFWKIDANRRQHSFEIFGFDFMIDENFKVMLIECNTNPCLELCSPLSARIIPALLDNAFRIAVDPMFPPPDFSMAKKNVMHEIMPLNKMELVFDERIQGKELRALFKDVPKLYLRIQDDEGEKDEDIDDGEQLA